MSETPTPRTDVFRASLDGMRAINQRDRLLSHARTLERELAESREAEASETRWAAQYKRERDESREQRDRLVGAIEHLIKGASDLANALDHCDDGPTSTSVLGWDRIQFAAKSLAAVKGGQE